MVRRLIAAALLLDLLGGCAAISGFFGVGKADVVVLVQGTHAPVEVVVEGLKPAKRTDRGWVLPITLGDELGREFTVEMPVRIGS